MPDDVVAAPEEPEEDGQVAGASAVEEFKRLLDEAEEAEADEGGRLAVMQRLLGSECNRETSSTNAHCDLPCRVASRQLC